jgi:uncharacterized protein
VRSRCAAQVHSFEVPRHNDRVLAAALAALAVTFPTGHAVLRTPAKTLTIKVELARTPAQRERGLMGRASLPPNRGMAFLYPAPHRGAYWMKDVRIPLSIAFWGRGGRILKILDMPICRRDPCPVYDPGVAFTGALEVNQGAFRRWRVRAGDVVQIRRG